MALSARIGLHLFAGELAQAASLVSEVAAVTAATGSRLPPYGALALAALQGRLGEASDLIRVTSDELLRRGEGMGLTLVQHATAVLYNGLGRYDEALVAAEQGSAHPEELGFSIWSLPELVEAAVRRGQPEVAAEALQQLAETTRASGTDWGLGIEARSRALLSEDEGAERLYLEAIERLSRTRLPLQVARARLLYGEWLRRQHRRVEGRDQLRAAHEKFTAMGVEGFAERARCELVATGETVRRRTVDTVLDLTPQEAHIASLARERLTNPEIGARLFLSPRTVEWHLRKVFTKLGITSRRQLDEALRRRELSQRPAL
jgi:DNA-binding CsgD family transcriptional regulator